MFKSLKSLCYSLLSSEFIKESCINFLFSSKWMWHYASVIVIPSSVSTPVYVSEPSPPLLVKVKRKVSSSNSVILLYAAELADRSALRCQETAVYE